MGIEGPDSLTLNFQNDFFVKSVRTEFVIALLDVHTLTLLTSNKW